jgi:hypothetical protein
MLLILLPFGVFFLCCSLQFLFIRRVRRTLVANHPDFWLKLSAEAFLLDTAVAQFAFWGGFKNYRYRDLNDPKLNSRVTQFRILGVVTFAAWAAFAIMGLLAGLGWARP